MKTLEEFIKEIEGSDALKNELKEIKDKTALADFLKKHGCDVSVNEFAEHIRSQGEGEIGDDEAEKASGGYLEIVQGDPHRIQVPFKR